MQVSSAGWSLYVDPTYSSWYNAHLSKWKRCEQCVLKAHANKRVFYRGSLPARVIFCGEFSSDPEAVTGFPFVGEAGRLLDSLIKQAIPGVPFLVCNLALCIPPRVNGSIRHTTRDERGHCVSRILELKERCEARLIAVGDPARISFGKTADGSIVQPTYIMSLRDQHVKRAIEMRSVVSKIRRAYEGGLSDADDNRIVCSRKVARR